MTKEPPEGLESFYRWDEVRYESFFILSLKAASISIKNAVGTLAQIGHPFAKELNDAGGFTVGVIRHPFDRIVAAMYSVFVERGMSFRDRFLKWKDNPHVCPVYPVFEGMRVDYWIRFEHLKDDWSGLQVAHEEHRKSLGMPLLTCPPYGKLDVYRFGALPGEAHKYMPGDVRPLHWRDALDWNEFMPLYEKDFLLNHEWERP